MMRATSFVLGCVLAAASAAAAAQVQQERTDPRATANISGRVTSATTGEPIHGATLRLVSFEVMRRARSAQTDIDGRYTFAGLVPGRYDLSARAGRHLALDFGQRTPGEPARPIDLQDGQSFADANFDLPATSAISGVVVDEFGDPAPDIAMRLSTATYLGRRVLLPAGGVFAATVTDDKGEFRIDNLAPGTYFLIGLTGAFADADTVGFSPTFFPGAVDPAGARPLTVGIAEDLKGVSFAMSPGRGADIAGNAVDEAGQPVASGTILLAPSHRSGMLIIARTVSDAGGRFAFRNVPPGEYTIQAFGRSPNGALGGSAFGSRTVALTGENLTDVVVRVPPGRVAHGRIAFDPPDATRPLPNQVRVTFRPVDFDSSPVVGGGGPPMTMDDDFTFEVQNLNGLRVLWTDIASPTWTLKKVLLDGKDVTDTPFDFRTEGVDGLEVVLTNRAASLSGTVTDAEGKPTRDYSVVVFSSETAHWTFPSRYLHLARPNQTGQFLIKGLPGADYLAVALPAVDERVWQDPDFLNAVRPLATLVQIADGASVAITLQITRRD